MEQDLDLAWFISTPFGKPFDGLITQEQYDEAFILAEFKLKGVKCYCPKIYPTALSIQISLILGQSVPTQDGSFDYSASNSSGKLAMVVEDEVYETKRKYELVQDQELVGASSPAGLLKSIIDSCKSPLNAGATLVKSVNLGYNCGCGPNAFYSRFADKSDN